MDVIQEIIDLTGVSMSTVQRIICEEQEVWT